MTIDWKALAAPFPPDAVSWRVGSISKRDKTKAKALAYLDARDVMNRLDDVCGPAGWQCRYSFADDKKTVCDIAIKVGDEWIWKADGAGDTDIEAEKGSLSSAFKRAAVRWGIGRYLYDLPSPWVTINEYKQIEDAEMPKLRALLAKDAAKPATAPPSTAAQPATKPATPAPASTSSGTWPYVNVEGETEKLLTGREWFVRMQADLRKYPPRKAMDLWAINAVTGDKIVDSANDAARPAALKMLNDCIASVDELRAPLMAG